MADRLLIWILVDLRSVTVHLCILTRPQLAITKIFHSIALVLINLRLLYWLLLARPGRGILSLSSVEHFFHSDCVVDLHLLSLVQVVRVGRSCTVIHVLHYKLVFGFVWFLLNWNDFFSQCCILFLVYCFFEDVLLYG